MSTELTVSIAFLVKSNGKDEKRTETVKRELLKKGMGVSYLPDYMIESGIKDGSLAKLDVNYEVGKYYIQIFHHRNKWVSAQMEEFITIAEEMIR